MSRIYEAWHQLSLKENSLVKWVTDLSQPHLMDLPHVSSGVSSVLRLIMLNSVQLVTIWHCSLRSVKTPELSLPTCLGVGAPPPWIIRHPHGLCASERYLSWTSLSLHALVFLFSLVLSFIHPYFPSSRRIYMENRSIFSHQLCS